MSHHEKKEKFLSSYITPNTKESKLMNSVDPFCVIYAKLVCRPQRDEFAARHIARWETQLAATVRSKYHHYQSAFDEMQQRHLEERDTMMMTKSFIHLTDMLTRHVEELDYLETSFASDIEQIKHAQRNMFREVVTSRYRNPLFDLDLDMTGYEVTSKIHEPFSSCDEDTIKMLEGMGFDESAAKIAISIADGNKEKAISMLVDKEFYSQVISHHELMASSSLMKRLSHLGSWIKSNPLSGTSMGAIGSLETVPSTRSTEETSGTFHFCCEKRLKFHLNMKRYWMRFELTCARDIFNPQQEPEETWRYYSDRYIFRSVSSILILPISLSQKKRYTRSSFGFLKDYHTPINHVSQQFFNYAEHSTDLLFDDLFHQLRSGHPSTTTPWIITNHSNVPHIQQTAFFFSQGLEDQDAMIDQPFSLNQFRQLLKYAQYHSIPQLIIPIPFNPTFRSTTTNEDPDTLQQGTLHLDAILKEIYSHLKEQVQSVIASKTPHSFPEPSLYPSRFRFLSAFYSPSFYRQLETYLISWLEACS
jgi:hypothetical protein